MIGWRPCLNPLLTVRLSCEQAKAFTSWSEAATWQATKKAALRHVVLQLEHSCLARAMAAWRSHAGTQAHLQSCLQRSILRLRNMAVGSAFAAWREHVGEQIHHRCSCYHAAMSECSSWQELPYHVLICQLSCALYSHLLQYLVQ